MTLEAEIARLAGVAVINRGSATLVGSDDALRIVDACSERGLTILGIDGFVLRGLSIVPDMEVIADFSDASPSESIRLAKQFVHATQRPGLWYEFALESVDRTGDPPR